MYLEKSRRFLERRDVLLDLRNSLHQVANEVDDCLDGRTTVFQIVRSFAEEIAMSTRSRCPNIVGTL